MTGGEETPRARMSLTQQEGKKNDRNLEEYYICRPTAIRNKTKIKVPPKKVVETPTSHQTSRRRQETESGKLRSIKFTTEKHELCDKEMRTAISKGEHRNGQYRLPFPESRSYKAEEHSRIWQEIWGRSHQDSLYRQTPRIVKVIVRGSIDKERYNQLKWEWTEVETRHLKSVDELERGTKEQEHPTKEKLATAQPGIVRNKGRSTLAKKGEAHTRIITWILTARSW